MSITSKSLILGSLVAATVLSGCKDATPSNQNVQEFLYQTVNTYSLYNEDFTIQSWQKLNGWPDNGNYVVSANVTMKSKIAYFDLMSECIVTSAPDLKGSWSQRTQLELSAMQAGAEGLDREFVSYWNAESEKKVWPKELKDVAGRLSQQDWNTLLKACDNFLVKKYDGVIDRTLVQGQQIVRTYQLKFRPTEKGWQGFSS